MVRLMRSANTNYAPILLRAGLRRPSLTLDRVALDPACGLKECERFTKTFALVARHARNDSIRTIVVNTINSEEKPMALIRFFANLAARRRGRIRAISSHFLAAYRSVEPLSQWTTIYFFVSIDR